MQNSLVMNWQEYLEHDAISLAQLVKKGDVTPTELAEQASQAITRVNPKINAVIEVFDDVIADPIKDGMAVDGAFYGVPLLLKDLGSKMRGRMQQCGYAWQQGDLAIAKQDDPLTTNFRNSGFNLIGRTTTPEDGMAALTESIEFGITRNPWELNYTAGGSSGGSAAAVAAGILPVCSASDGGGSIRLPASWNNLIGFKSTRGRLPLMHGVDEAILPSAVEGVVTRSLRDAAAIYDQISHRPIGSGFMPFPATPSLSEQINMPARKMRIALSTDDWSRADTVPAEYKQRIHEVAALLEQQGHIVDEVKQGDICDFAQLFESNRILNWMLPLGSAVPAMAEYFGVQLNADNTSSIILDMIEESKSYGVDELFASMSGMAQVTQQWGQFWQRGYDVMLTLTAGVYCPQAEHPQYSLLSDISFNRYFELSTDLCRYTMPGNATGLPSISLPAGLDPNGCPLGMQFYAPWNHDHHLFHLASQIEQIKPEWFNTLAPFNVANAVS